LEVLVIETEQLVAEAARLQVAWHYARLLSPLEHRHDALLRRNLGPESEQEVAALQAEIAALEDDITALRGQASSVGVLGSELQRVLAALKRERRLLAVMVAAELSAPSTGGSYARDEHLRWGIPDEPAR